MASGVGAADVGTGKAAINDRNNSDNGGNMAWEEKKEFIELIKLNNVSGQL